MSDESLPCPLVTEYTRKKSISDETLERLYYIRKWDIEKDEQGNVINPIPFKWPSALRSTIWDVDKRCDSGVPLILRQYQIQMIYHLAMMPKFMCGDAVGLGKTLDVVASACWLKERYPDFKVIVVTTKSTTYQWEEEFERFSTLRPFVMRDEYRGKSSSEARYAQMRDFLSGQKKDVLICKYTSLIGTRRKIEGKFDEDGEPVKGREAVSQEVKTFAKIMKEHKEKIILVFDECHKFKGDGSSTRNLVFSIARQAGRVWALTATAIKNNVTEFYAIASAVGICPFGWMAEFMDMFCEFGKKYIGRGRYKRVLRGYVNLPDFKKGIRPFYLGRSQRQVKEPLPVLQTKYHPIDLDDKQSKLLLHDIPSGEFQLPPTLIKVAGQWHEKERDPNNLMTLLSVQQLVANHWALIDPMNESEYHTKKLSPKEEALLDLLDGDLLGEKVIVFSKYKCWIDRLQWLTENGHFTKRKFLRITGDENEKQRNINKRLFQNDEEHDLIVINAAGLEGINLQQAAHMVCLDLPWSWGDLIQLVGRMVRMASPHTSCTLHVMVAKGTVDEYTIETLKGKKGVFEFILGESHSAGILDDKVNFDLDGGMEADSDEEFKIAMMKKAHVKGVSMKTFITGEQILAAQGEDYQMSFDKKGKKKGKKKQTDLDASKWGQIDLF